MSEPARAGIASKKRAIRNINEFFDICKMKNVGSVVGMPWAPNEIKKNKDILKKCQELGMEIVKTLKKKQSK